MNVGRALMKKVLLWHIMIGFAYIVVLYTTSSIESIVCKLILTVGFMVVASAGYVFFGVKGYGKKALFTALILLAMTLATQFLINPICAANFTRYPLTSLLLFPYGGAMPFIQLGVYLAVKDIYFGVILGDFALLIPSVLTLTGVFATRIKQRVQK